jgi:hypothetical protein
MRASPSFAEIQQTVRAETAIRHDEERRELWRAVAAAVASSLSDDPSAMHRWADKAVEEYDARFAPRELR